MNLSDPTTPPTSPQPPIVCLATHSVSCYMTLKTTGFSSAKQRDWSQPSCTAQTGSLPCLACLSCGNTASQRSAGFTTMKFPVAWFEGTRLAGERYTWPWEWDSRSKTAVSDWTFTGDAFHAKKRRRMKLFNAILLNIFKIPYDAFFAKLLNCFFFMTKKLPPGQRCMS